MSASATTRVGHARAPLVMFHNISVDDNEVAEAAVFFFFLRYCAVLIVY